MSAIRMKCSSTSGRKITDVSPSTSDQWSIFIEDCALTEHQEAIIDCRVTSVLPLKRFAAKVQVVYLCSGKYFIQIQHEIPDADLLPLSSKGAHLTRIIWQAEWRKKGQTQRRQWDCGGQGSALSVPHTYTRRLSTRARKIQRDYRGPQYITILLLPYDRHLAPWTLFIHVSSFFPNRGLHVYEEECLRSSQSQIHRQDCVLFCKRDETICYSSQTLISFIGQW